MDINNNIISLINNTPDAVLRKIARRYKQRRLEMEYTQKQLAEKAGIPLPTYRKFEQTGEISLKKLVILGFVLNFEDDFDMLFAEKRYKNLDDILNGQKTRKRGRRQELKIKN